MLNVAFIGLGAMGLPMAQNLLKQGYSVRGFDLSQKAVAAFKDSGGHGASSAIDAVSGVDLVILMVVNSSQAEEVLLGGLLKVMPDKAIVCLMATCPQSAVERIAAVVLGAGRGFIDAPVSGGTAGAVTGSLTIMAACDIESFRAVKPALEVLGKRIFHVGTRPGQGAMVKTVNQLLCGVHIAAVAEAFSLAAKAGVDLTVLLEIMSGSSASSWMLNDRGPRMLKEKPEVSSAVEIFVKDLGIVLDTGRDTRSALPITAAAHQMFLSASGRGEGHLDDSQVIKSYYQLNGVNQSS